jgi:hypothetical protein
MKLPSPTIKAETEVSVFNLTPRYMKEYRYRVEAGSNTIVLRVSSKRQREGAQCLGIKLGYPLPGGYTKRTWPSRLEESRI